MEAAARPESDYEEFELDDGRHYIHDYDRAPPKEGWRDDAVRVAHKLLLQASKCSTHRGSIYTGQCGIALALIELEDMGFFGKEKRTERLQAALLHSMQSLRKIHPKRVTFLEGVPGALAVTSVLCERLGKTEDSKRHLKECLKYAKHANSLASSECEVLYGRCGYLFSLLYLRHKLKDDTIGREESRKIVKAVIAKGVKAARKMKDSRLPHLYYEWYDKCYLGAAHGICGILKVLLHFRAEVEKEEGKEGMETLRKALLALLELKFETYNMPSSLGSTRDKLVHWCHGATGYVSLCLLASQVFCGGDKKGSSNGKDAKDEASSSDSDTFMRHAKMFGHVIWKRGILAKKGLGLCHGTPGNGMALLSLYRATGDKMWLTRAEHFVSFLTANYSTLVENSDNPWSLYTGALGAVMFIAGTTLPERSGYIGYEVDGH